MTTRSARQRRTDTLDAFGNNRDVWVSSADAAGQAHLIPLSFLWDGKQLILATPAASKTARNLQRAGWARVALPSPDDVVIVDGTVAVVACAENPVFADAHAAATGFDPRIEPEPYVYLRIGPVRIQAWRDVAELDGRTIMRDGQWIDD